MKSRNNTVDIIRGLAMLMVVLQHTMSNCTVGANNSLLFQVLWTCQLPLFIIISGYVTRYSHSISSIDDLCKFYKKRSLAYLMPWAVWTLVVRGLIFGKVEYFDPEFLFWHTDSGYWFLLTIWTISIIFGMADLISNKFAKDKKSFNIFLHIAFCGVGMIVLGTIGYVLGLSFFGIKLSLYYLPIYLIGYLYGQVQDKFMSKPYSSSLVNVAIVFCLGLWLAIINRFDFFAGADTPAMIVLRFFTSILGCSAIIGALTSFHDNEGSFSRFLWVGRHSLEVYLTHYLLLNLFSLDQMPILMSLSGVALLMVNFLTTIGFTYLLIVIVQHNSTLNYILYAKQS